MITAHKKYINWGTFKITWTDAKRLSFKKKILVWLLFFARFHWIVELNEKGEKVSFGFKVFGIPVFYYKWHDVAVICKDDLPHRVAQKRELYPEGFVGG